MSYRHDTGKARMDLCPAIAHLEWARVMSFGCDKYGDQTWRNGMKWSCIIASLERHTNSFKSGEIFDSESGLPHMAHVMANAAFLIDYQLTHPEMDDRIWFDCNSNNIHPGARFTWTSDYDVFSKYKPWMRQHYPHIPYFYCPTPADLFELRATFGIQYVE